MSNPSLQSVPLFNNLEVIYSGEISMTALAAATAGNAVTQTQTLNTGLNQSGGFIILAFHSFAGGKSYNPLPVIQPILDTAATTQSGAIEWIYSIFADNTTGPLIITAQAINYNVTVGTADASILIYVINQRAKSSA